VADEVAKVLKIAAVNPHRERRGVVVAAAEDMELFGPFEENWT
jgi:hypothetical protein